MHKLTREDLFSLEKYAEIRDEFRSEVMAHKEKRRLEIGENLCLLFEDRLLMHYQVQEMLKVERIFEADGIQEELDAYNPLIPDGTNWKVTMMIQFPDVEQREKALVSLLGIEDVVWVRVDGCEKVFAIADEDLDRSTDTKTSAVHFLRFELDAGMINKLHDGSQLAAGCDHAHYKKSVEPLSTAFVAEIITDLEQIQ